MSVASEPGFTAVNGRSPPSWQDRVHSTPNNPPASTDANLFANHKPDQPARIQEDTDCRKRKRDEGDMGISRPESAQRQRVAPSSAQDAQVSIPSATNEHTNGIYHPQGTNSQTSRPQTSSMDENSQHHQQRPATSDQTTDHRPVDTFRDTSQHHQPNNNYQTSPNGNAPANGHPQTNETDGQQPPDQQSPNHQIQATGGAGAPRPEKNRKRNFANRTKTGCITCRERKKKCDEGKPMCNNCQRGGFDCKGYSQTQQLRAGGLPPQLVQKPDGGPFAVHGTAAYTTAPFPPNGIYYPGPPHMHDHSRPHMPPRDDPARVFMNPTMPPEYSRPPFDPHMSPFDGMRPEYSQPPPIPDYSREKKQLPPMSLSSSVGPAMPYARGSPQDMAQLALSTPNNAINGGLDNRTEKDKMVNHSKFDPNDPVLRQDRKKCAKFVHAFNKGCEDPNILKDHEKRSRFKDIIEGAEGSASSPRGTTELRGSAIGSNVDVEAPFYCDYGYNIKIGDGTEIGRNCTIADACTVRLGKNCTIGSNVNFLTQDIDKNSPRTMVMGGHSKRLAIAKPITIGSNVYIGPGSTILSDIRIGDDVVIPAGTIVDRNIHSGMVVERDSPRIRLRNGPWANPPPQP